MIIGLPSGIGDVSWALSKLFAVKHLIERIEVADGWPYRTKEYVELAGWTAEYGAFDYKTIEVSMQANTLAPKPGWRGPSWSDVLRTRGWDHVPSVEEHTGARILLEPNRHLEKGQRLEDWLWDLPTVFHYDLATTAEDKKNALEIIEAACREVNMRPDAPMVAVSCSSNRGAKNWQTWGREEWLQVIEHILDEGWIPLMVGGFWDDLTSHVARKLRIPCVVGRTNTAEMIEIMRELPGYIGFSSGMNVIRTVLDKPAMAFWPDFQVELSTSWAPPEMIRTGRYQAMRYVDPTEAWPQMRSFLRLCEREAANGHAPLLYRAGMRSFAAERALKEVIQ